MGRAERPECEYVVMGGFLKHVLIPPDFENRVLNIHPALLPAFGGKGMYGLRVHEAVLAAGEKRSGCTVHFVDNEYDHGPVILQRQVEVRAGGHAGIAAGAGVCGGVRGLSRSACGSSLPNQSHKSYAAAALGVDSRAVWRSYYAYM